MSANKQPNYIAYVVQKSNKENGKDFYQKVGAAWDVANGGVSVQLFATPVDGKVLLFPPREKE